MRGSRRGWAPNAPRISIRNGRSGCGAICHAIPPDASASPKSRQWKATRDQPRIRFSSTSQLRRKPIAPLTISLTKRANRFCECWRVFLVKMCSARSEEHTSELQSPCNLVCRLLLEKKKKQKRISFPTIRAQPLRCRLCTSYPGSSSLWCSAIVLERDIYIFNVRSAPCTLHSHVCI